MSRRTRTALLAAGLVAGLLVGCSSDDGGDDATKDTKATTSSTSAPATTASTAPPPSEPSAPTQFTTDARDASNELKDAWETGDQGRARAIAPGDVVDALFLVPADGWETYGCDSGEFETSICNYRNRGSGGYISVNLQKHPEGWQVASIDINGD